MTLSEYKITCCSTADMPAAYFERKNLPLCLLSFSDGWGRVSG